ncbi:MAG: hypothetical protein Q7W29_08280 [bacterium]|nr:hypothetical protein [bacterium]
MGRRVALTAFVAAVTAAAWATPADALPRYSARYGQSCLLCHENPTGGGMRSAYAAEYLIPEELAAPSSPEARFSPEIGERVAVGADLRTLLYESDGSRDGVLAMQADVYLSVHMDDRTSVYVERGRGGQGEAFGTARLLPADGYLKAGRFLPAYGWRFADHQLPARRYLFHPEGNDRTALLLDDGLELGLAPEPFEVTISYLAGPTGEGGSYAGRVAARRSLGDLNLALGASVWRARRSGGHDRVAGGFGYAAAGPVSWVWQLDETRVGGDLGRLITHELAVRVRRGWDLRATYGFQDPDRALADGSRTSWSLGVDALLGPHLGAMLVARREVNDPGPRSPEPDATRGELVLHVLF